MNESRPASPGRRAPLVGLGAVVVTTGAAALFSRRKEVVPGPVVSKVPERRTVEPPAGETAAVEETSVQAPSLNPGQLTPELFRPHLKSVFEVRSAGRGVAEIQLVKVGPATTIGDQRSSFLAFTLMFSGPKEPQLESAIYCLKHPALGEMDLMISPVGDSKDQSNYEAAFTQRI